jgi:hypothetical protein
MWTRRIGWAGAVGVLLLFACTSGADNCDSDCRMRQNFYICGQDFCIYMDRADCGKCTAANSVCDKANPVAAGTCQVSGTNQGKVYSGCLVNCSCTGRVQIEAQAVEILGGTWISRDWWRCYVDVPPPP